MSLWFSRALVLETAGQLPLPTCMKRISPMKRYAYMKTIILLFVLPFALGGVALGQEITGNLAGNVKDSSGAIVKGATVVVTDALKNSVVRTVETNDEGNFSVPNLQAGIYSISVEATN